MEEEMHLPPKEDVDDLIFRMEEPSAASER